MEFLEKFRNLEKLESPDKWAKENYPDLNWFNDMVSVKASGKKEYLYIVPLEQNTFYSLFDEFDRLKVNFKIYPIMSRKYWVVEVKK